MSPVPLRLDSRSRDKVKLVFNTPRLRIKAGLAGLGLAFLPEDQVRFHIAGRNTGAGVGKLVLALPRYHLYYPQRRQSSRAFRLLVEALRYRS